MRASDVTHNISWRRCVMAACGHTRGAWYVIAWPFTDTCVTELAKKHARRSLVPLRVEGSASVPAMIYTICIIIK